MVLGPLFLPRLCVRGEQRGVQPKVTANTLLYSVLDPQAEEYRFYLFEYCNKFNEMRSKLRQDSTFERVATRQLYLLRS